MAKNFLVDIRIERAIIGALLKHEDAIYHVLDIPLESRHFGNQRHKALYQSCLSLFEHKGNLDPYTLIHFTKKEGKIEEKEAEKAIAQVMQEACSMENLNTYIKIVIELFFRREIQRLSKYADHVSQDQTTDPFDLPQLIQEQVDKIVQFERGEQQIAEIGKERIKELRSKKLPLFTGYPSLDSKTKGFKEGQLIVIAGRTGMGKTNVLLALANNFAEQSIGVAFFSLEMDSNELYDRIIAGKTNTRLDDIEQAEEETIKNLESKTGHLQSIPLFVENTYNLNITKLTLKARKLVKQKGIKVICLDYIQLMNAIDGQKNTTREQVVASISRGLKQMAKELNIVVLAGAQLNRLADSREGNQPALSDIRESGAVEQDADKVILLFRNSYYENRADANIGHITGNGEEKDAIQLNIAKNRQGKTGSCTLIFDAEYARIREPETETFYNEYYD